MKYWYQQPHKSLSDYVRTILVLEGFSTEGDNNLPLFTNGMPAFVCRTEKNEDGHEIVQQLSLFGKSTPPGYWLINERTSVVAYFFKPFALASLFNISAAVLVKEPVELSTRNPHKMTALRTQLSYAGSAADKIKILDHLLLLQLESQLRDCEIIRTATDEMMNDTGTEVITALLKKLHLNERTFQRLFKKYVGITPVQYRRVCQFQLSFAQVRAKDFAKLGDIAYANGFADQSHFIRSFREFTQTTPNNYLKSGLTKEE